MDGLLEHHQVAIDSVLQDDLTRQLERMEAQRRDKAAEEGAVRAGQQYPFDMSHDISADTSNLGSPETTRLTVPFDGELERVILGSSDSPRDAFGVRLSAASGVQFLPRNEQGGYLPGTAFGDFDFNGVPLDKDDVLVAEFVNFDTTNAHFVSVTPVIRISARKSAT